jgi:lipid A 4'-phosphatase
MNRTGFLIALALAVLVGVPFAIFPQLDLRVVAPFFDPARDGFWVRLDPTLRDLREWSNWVIALIAAPAFLAIPVKLLLPRLPLLVPGRAIILIIATLALAPGLLTNLVLKDYWGRSRPIDVAQFGGDEHFVPWWDPRGDCPKNCSFVAGEPSGAFWTLAPAALLPPPWRALGTAAALTFGAAVGLLRMASGGHFFTDVVFAGVLTFLVIWLTHGLLYRWAATRISDEAVERALEHIALPGYNAALRLVERVRILMRMTRPPS